MRYFHMVRNVDITGNSGTGKVADVLTDPSGWTFVLWSEESNALGVSSTVLYRSLDDAIKVHGHGGLTEFVEQPFTPASVKPLWLRLLPLPLIISDITQRLSAKLR